MFHASIAATVQGGKMNLSKSFVLSCSFAVLTLVLAQPAWCIDIDAAEAPANDLALTVNAINSAQKTLQLNIYELSSPEVADALLSRIQAGVQVQILEEGQPVGGLSAASKGIVSQLVQAMRSAGNSDFLYEMTSKAGGHRRFRYDHAKYVVIDSSSVLVGSENYSPTGNPEPGTVGNRGWEVLIHDSQLAQTFAQTFVSDSDPSNRDIMDMGSQGVAYAFALVNDVAKKKPRPRPIKPVPVPAPFPGANSTASSMQVYSQSMTASAVDSFASPDTSLSGLQALFENATTSMDIELMTFHQDWGASGGQSPLLTSLLNAAKRGVRIRVLLNDETVFNTNGKTSKPVNRLTIQTLQNAAAQGLPIQALVANIKAMGVDYIHNKGAVLDGNKTMISSINWDQNSVQRNRETAVVITSSDVFSHYEALFEQDWEASGGSSSSAMTAENYRLAAPIDLEGPVQADSVNCPSSVDVSVDIGKIAPQSGEDSSFTALSGQSFELQMTRDRTSKSCIFTTLDRATRRRVFEIRGSHGGTLFILEGYTSAGKLYSIRARSDDGVQSSQSLDARVYEGSGGHQALGDAEMDVSTQ